MKTGSATARCSSYLPGIALKLYHSRDHGEPFDFLTWFEFAPDQEASFDHMLVRMRACAEWDYVDREIDIRLTRASLTTKSGR